MRSLSSVSTMAAYLVFHCSAAPSAMGTRSKGWLPLPLPSSAWRMAWAIQSAVSPWEMEFVSTMMAACWPGIIMRQWLYPGMAPLW